MSNAGGQKVMAKSKSHSQKELHAKRKKESYAQMEPAMKKQVLSNKAIWYKSLDPAEKEKLLSRRAEGHKSLDPKEKQELLFKSADWYKSLAMQKNKIFCLTEQFGINHWILRKNKREQNGLTRSILHKNKKQQNSIIHWILKKKKNIFQAEQNDIEPWILQIKIRLYDKSKVIRKPAETQFNMIEIIRSQLFKVRLGKVHILCALFVTEYYTEKLLSS